ncbi:hypothetical protein [Roseovarius tibetensis]
MPVDNKWKRLGDHEVILAVGMPQALTRRKWRTIEVHACPVTGCRTTS